VKRESEKLVACGYPGCRNTFTIDPRKGEPYAPYCGHHVTKMAKSIRHLLRKRKIHHG
jgi:hypothetical protein